MATEGLETPILFKSWHYIRVNVRVFDIVSSMYLVQTSYFLTSPVEEKWQFIPV